MSTESITEQIERVRGMAAGDLTWDLSENDKVALNTILAANQASERALTYFVERLQDNPDVRYYCGFGTEIFYRTAQAIAAITGKPMEEVESVMREDRQPAHRRREAEVHTLRDKIDELRRQLDHVPGHRAMRA